MANHKKNDKDKRTNTIHLAFSDNELEKIDKYVEKHVEGALHTTRTSFIREAIFEKIIRIENPDKFGKVSSNEEQIQEIKDLVLLQIEHQKQMEKQLIIYNEVKKQLHDLAPLINKEELKQYCETLVTMLKQYKKKSLNDLILLTGYTQEIIIQCIEVNPKLELTKNKEVILIE